MKRGFVDTFLYWLDPRNYGTTHENYDAGVRSARELLAKRPSRETVFRWFQSAHECEHFSKSLNSKWFDRAGRDTFRKESGFELPGNHYGRPETNRDWRGKEIPAQPVNQGEPVK